MSTFHSTIKRIRWVIILLVIWKVLMNLLSQRNEKFRFNWRMPTKTNSQWVTYWQTAANNETLVNRKEQYNKNAEKYRQLVIQEQEKKKIADAQAIVDGARPSILDEALAADGHVDSSKGKISDYTWL